MQKSSPKLTIQTLKCWADSGLTVNEMASNSKEYDTPMRQARIREVFVTLGYISESNDMPVYKNPEYDAIITLARNVKEHLPDLKLIAPRYRTLSETRFPSNVIPEQIEQTIKLYEENKTSHEVAKEMNASGVKMSHMTVLRIVHAAELEPHSRGARKNKYYPKFGSLTDEQIQKAEELHLAGKTNTDICKEFRLSGVRTSGKTIGKKLAALGYVIKRGPPPKAKANNNRVMPLARAAMDYRASSGLLLMPPQPNIMPESQVMSQLSL